MCGRMAFDITLREVEEHYKINMVLKSFSPRFNVAPSQEVPAIIAGSRVLNLFRWGLIPVWAKDSKIGYKMINARAETLEDKPSYRSPFHKNRCAIVCSNFYEWNKKTKTPFYIGIKNKKMFTMAGLYSLWKDSNGHIVPTCTVITTKANKSVGKIHDRMPVILEDNDIDDWINPAIKDPTTLNKMLKPYNDSKMKIYEISTYVNSPKHDDLNVLKPIE